MYTQLKSHINLNKTCSATLILLAFTIPVSTAATYMALGIFLFFWILDNAKNPFVKLTAIIKSNPLAKAGCAFFLVHLPGLLYTHANLEKILESIQNGGKFLFIAMAMVYLKEEKNVRAVLISFIGAMGTVLVLSYLIRISMVPAFIPVKGTPMNCYVFHDHIKHNTLMAFTVFVTAVLARSAKTGKASALWAGFSSLAFINVLLMVNGRTGHLIILILFTYYFLSWRSRKSITVLLSTCFCMGFLIWVYPSNPLMTRARIAINEIKTWNYGEPASELSSSGLRLELYTNSLKIIKKNPFIGTGTGNFQTAYAELINGTGFNRSDNPHNEFLMAGVQFGMLGILVLLCCFITQWVCAASLKSTDKRLLARGLVLTTITACMVASPLQDSAEGWFFALMSATLFAPQTQTNA